VNVLALYSDNIVRADVWSILDKSPNEVPAVLEMLHDGIIDGRTYEYCLIGTIAKLRGLTYATLPGITPDRQRPAELLFACIHMEDTPRTSLFAAFAAHLITEWKMQT
jgi:hypothetical protein